MKRNKVYLYIVLSALFLICGCGNQIQYQKNESETVIIKEEIINFEPTNDNLSIVNDVKYNEEVCDKNEHVILSFELENTSQKISICEAEGEEDYIVFRIGTIDNIDFEFPINKEDSWNKFTYSNYLRGGGQLNDGVDFNYLSFENDGKMFTIFQEYTAEQDIIDVGLKVLDLETEQETILVGLSKTMNGSLDSLRENVKIKQE